MGDVSLFSRRGRQMPSPFPGMDPYLEAHWRDVHARLVIYASEALQGVLPSGLRARVEECVLLEETRTAPGVAVAEPLLVEADPELVTEPFLEIIDCKCGNRV